MTFIDQSRLVMSSFKDFYLLEVTFTGLEVTGTAEYAGSKGNCGYDYTKHRLDMRLEGPTSVNFDGNRTLFTAVMSLVEGEATIVRIDTTTGQGEPVCNVDGYVMRLMSDNFSNSIYMTSITKFQVIEITEGISTVRSLIDYDGNGTGALSATGLNATNGLMQLREKLWLICDRGNNRQCHRFLLIFSERYGYTISTFMMSQAVRHFPLPLQTVASEPDIQYQ